MNIISSNCLSGHLYRDYLNTEFENPFAWTVIDFKSMLYLVEKWNTINFKNYELVKDINWNFSIIIDNNVKVQYVHYKFSPKATTILQTKPSTDIFYNKIWEYIVDVYNKRLNRMTNPPLFCIMNFKTIFKDAIYTNEQLDILSKFDNVKILKGFENLEPLEATSMFYKHFFEKV